jgi:hypothetical protein
VRSARDRVARLRRDRALRAQVEALLASGDVAVLKPLEGMDMADPAASAVVSDVVTDFVATYGTTRSPEPGHLLLQHPLGLLELPAEHGEYLERVGPKTRNMIRKAAKSGYEYREFRWNDHLEEIHAVNTSAELRQGRPMQGWYAQPVEPRDESPFKKYFGAFSEDRLWGYLHLVLCGDFGFFRHFLGHADHLGSGVMNGLVSWTVDRYAGDSAVKWLKYGALVAGEDPAAAFRRHAGFKPYATLLELGGLEHDPVVLLRALDSTASPAVGRVEP